MLGTDERRWPPGIVRLPAGESPVRSNRVSASQMHGANATRPRRSVRRHATRSPRPAPPSNTCYRRSVARRPRRSDSGEGQVSTRHSSSRPSAVDAPTIGAMATAYPARAGGHANAADLGRARHHSGRRYSPRRRHALRAPVRATRAERVMMPESARGELISASVLRV